MKADDSLASFCRQGFTFLECGVAVHQTFNTCNPVLADARQGIQACRRQ